MKGLMWYYLTRAGLALLAAGVAWRASGSPWLATAAGVVMMAVFVWYARSGHFVVDSTRPLAPLQRDEREQAITQRAATYAFVTVMVGLALVNVLHPSAQWSSRVLLGGLVVYFLARAWLRHVM